MVKRLFIALVSVAMYYCASAYDFSAVNNRGQRLYYNILQAEDNVVEVTSPLGEGTYRWLPGQSPRGVLDIPSEVEYNDIDYTVVAIGERAFSDCGGIIGLVIPESVTAIEAYAFYNCDGIQGTVTIGRNIHRIERSVFYGCNGITEVRFEAENCEKMGGSKGTTAFGNCASLRKITFSDNVRIIPDYAFYGMDGLNMSWRQLPDKLEFIGEYAFGYCHSIKGKLKIPNDVKVIGPYAFARCHSATEIEIPARIERIDQRAFYQCIGVEQITVKALVPPTVGNDIFEGIPSKAVLNVPCVSVDRYKKASGWNVIKNISAVNPCTIDIYARSLNGEGGHVIGGGSYRIGETATLIAVCHAGYGFTGWSDGVKDNPRTIVVNDTGSYYAIIEPSVVVHDIEYVHDTTYMDGVEVVYEYYEVNDVAEDLSEQNEIAYNQKRRRLEIPIDKRDLVDVSLYNEAGQCLFMGKPNRGRVKMRRFPTGSYVVRISTIEDEWVYKFFHKK